MIPFGLGLVANRVLPLVPAIPALVLVTGLLVILIIPRWKAQRATWHFVFFIATFSLGGMYGARVMPRIENPGNHHPSPPREEVLSAEPVQTFVSPPYSSLQLGLGQIPGEEGLLYFKAPGGNALQPLPRGFLVEFFGVKRPLEHLVDDAGFRTYLKDRGVTFGVDSLRPGKPVALESLFRAVFFHLLEKSKEALTAGSLPLNPETRVYQALVLGQRTGLDSDQKRIFRDTGTAHLFAISGLHVGLVGGFLFFLLRSLRVRTRIQIFGTLSILLFYVLLTGATPSAVRAYLMIAFLLGAKAFQRAYCPTSALAASALVVLLIDPLQLSTLGFQLSYIVVLSILVFGGPLSQTLMKRTDPEYWLPGQSGSPFHRSRRWLFGSFAISLAAFFGSAPLIMDHFDILPLSSVFLNLLLIFPATIVLLIGFVSLFAGLFGVLWLSAPLNMIAGWMIGAMTGIVSTAADLPLSAIPTDFVNPWAGPAGTFLFLAAVFWTASRPRFRIRYLALPAACVVLTALFGRIPIADLP